VSVIVELGVPVDAFELGRILPGLDDVEYSLETLVPIGEAPVPLLRVHDGETANLVDAVTDHPSANEMTLLTGTNGDEIYWLDWEHESDEFLTAVRESGGHLLSGNSHCGRWQFRVQFPDPDSLSVFNDLLRERGVEDDVLSVTNSWSASRGDADALTTPQREAFEVAYQAGYYDIPRQASTADVAEQLGISDQALSERLRRGTARLIQAAVLRSKG